MNPPKKTPAGAAASVCKATVLNRLVWPGSLESPEIASMHPLMIRYALHLIERESNNKCNSLSKGLGTSYEHYLEVLGFQTRNSYAKTASFCTLF